MVHHAEQMNLVGLSNHVRLWLSRLVVQHRFMFELFDEIRLVFVLLKLPSNWLLDWAAGLIQLHPPTASNLPSIQHFLFVLEVAICSYRLEDTASPTAPAPLEGTSFLSLPDTESDETHIPPPDSQVTLFKRRDFSR